MMDFAHARWLVRGQDQAATVSVSGGIDAQIRGTDHHSTRPSPGLPDPRAGVSEVSPIVAFAHARSLARDEDQASTRILRRFDSPADIEAQIYGRGRQTAPSPGLDLWRRRPSGVEAKIHGTDYQSIRSSPGRILGFDTTVDIGMDDFQGHQQVESIHASLELQALSDSPRACSLDEEALREDGGEPCSDSADHSVVSSSLPPSTASRTDQADSDNATDCGESSGTNAVSATIDQELTEGRISWGRKKCQASDDDPRQEESILASNGPGSMSEPLSVIAEEDEPGVEARNHTTTPRWLERVDVSVSFFPANGHRPNLESPPASDGNVEARKAEGWGLDFAAASESNRMRAGQVNLDRERAATAERVKAATFRSQEVLPIQNDISSAILSGSGQDSRRGDETPRASAPDLKQTPVSRQVPAGQTHQGDSLLDLMAERELSALRIAEAWTLFPQSSGPLHIPPPSTSSGPLPARSGRSYGGSPSTPRRLELQRTPRGGLRDMYVQLAPNASKLTDAENDMNTAASNSVGVRAGSTVLKTTASESVRTSVNPVTALASAADLFDWVAGCSFEMCACACACTSLSLSLSLSFSLFSLSGLSHEIKNRIRNNGAAHGIR